VQRLAHSTSILAMTGSVFRQDTKSKTEGPNAWVNFARILAHAREKVKRSDGQGAKRRLGLFEGNLAPDSQGLRREYASLHVMRITSRKPRFENPLRCPFLLAFFAVGLEPGRAKPFASGVLYFQHGTALLGDDAPDCVPGVRRKQGGLRCYFAFSRRLNRRGVRYPQNSSFHGRTRTAATRK